MAKRIRFRYVSVLSGLLLLVSLLCGCTKHPEETPTAKSGWLVQPAEQANASYAIPQGQHLVQGDWVYHKINISDYMEEMNPTDMFCRTHLTTGEREVLYTFAPTEMVRTPYFEGDSAWFTVITSQGPGCPIEKTHLLRLGLDGQVQETIDLTAVLEEEEYAWGIFATADRLLIPVTGTFQDEEGVMYGRERLLCLDKTGALQFSLDYPEEGNSIDWFTLADGRVALIAHHKLLTVDLQKQTWGEVFDFSSLATAETDSLKPAEARGSYLFLVQRNSDDLFGYVAETGELERLFSWEERGIVWDGGNLLYQTEKDEIVAASGEYIVRMSPCAPQDEIVPTGLTLAGIQIPEGYRDYAIRFNRMNPHWRLALKEYAPEGTSVEEAALKLNTELLSGEVPDILYTGNGVSTEDLIRRGLLADLYPLLDSGDGLSRKDFVDGVLKAQEVEGKLYQLAPSFTLSTWLGDKTVVGDGTLNWTRIDSLTARYLEKGLFQYDLARDQVMGYLCKVALPEFAADTFETERFLRLLEVAKGAPTLDEIMSLSMSDRWIELSGVDELAEGRILFEHRSLQSVGDFQRIRTRLGEKAAFVGYPTGSGTGTWIEMSGSLAITTACEDKAGAWRLLQQCLLEEAEGRKFSTLEQMFAAELSEAMQNNKNSEGNPILVNGKEMVLLTTKDCEQLRQLIKTASPVGYRSAEVEAIIEKEASYFFAGKCTAQKAAANIQSRVQLYMNEQM